MKKGFLLLIVIMAYTTTVIAQNSSIGVRAGITLASQKAKFEDESVTSDHKVGFTVGAMIDIPLGAGFSVQPGLNFLQKGGKFDESGFKSTNTLNYLEVPVNILYNIEAGPGKVFVGVGPSIAYALSGKSKYEALGMEEEEDIEFGDGEDEMKRLDFGINFLAGYRFNPGIVVTANFTPGLSNLYNSEDDDDGTFKNRYFGFTVGYFFNR